MGSLFRPPGYGDEAFRKRFLRRQRRQLVWQAAVLALVVAVLWYFAGNIASNLASHGIRSGFGFLSDRSSFEIGESLVTVTSQDSFARMFLAGVLNTLRVAAVSIVTASLLGLAVGVMRLSRHGLLRFLGAAHVELYRNVPLLIQLFTVYLVITEFLPDIFEPLTLGSWVMLSKSGFFIACPEHLALANAAAAVLALAAAAAVYRSGIKTFTREVAVFRASVVFGVLFCAVWLASGLFGISAPQLDGFAVEGGIAMTPEFIALWTGLTLFTSASIAEIVRAGILTVGRNQQMAGRALGLTDSQVLSNIILPQSLKLVVPPLASQYMNLTKNSSLAVIIGYPDIVNIGNTSIVIMGQALEAILIIMSVYLTINLAIALAMGALNTRINAPTQRGIR